MYDLMIPSSKAAGDSGLSFSPAHIFYCCRSELSFGPVCIVTLYCLDYISCNIKYFMQSEGTPVKVISSTCTPRIPCGIVFHSKCISLKSHNTHGFWKTEKKRLALIIYLFWLSWCPLQIIKKLCCWVLIKCIVNWFAFTFTLDLLYLFEVQFH